MMLAVDGLSIDWILYLEIMSDELFYWRLLFSADAHSVELQRLVFRLDGSELISAYMGFTHNGTLEQMLSINIILIV